MIEAIRREQGDDVSTVEIPGPSSNSAGRYSDTSAGFSSGRLAASSNATSDTVSQSSRNPRSRNRSWSGSLYHMGVNATIYVPLHPVTEGVMDWSESPHQMYVPDCKLQTMMYSYTMSREDLFRFSSLTSSGT